MSTHERQKVCPQVILTGSLSKCSQRRHLSRGFSCLSLSRSLSQSSIPTILKMVFLVTSSILRSLRDQGYGTLFTRPNCRWPNLVPRGPFCHALDPRRWPKGSRPLGTRLPLTKLSEQARQGRKTADWLKKIPLRAYGAFLGSKLSATFYMAN